MKHIARLAFGLLLILVALLMVCASDYSPSRIVIFSAVALFGVWNVAKVSAK